MAKNKPTGQKSNSQFQASSLSVRTVIIVLSLVLVIGLAGIVMLKYAHFSEIRLSSSKKTTLIDDFNRKIENANLNNQSPVIISEAEANTIISENKEFPLRNPKLKVFSDKIVVTGKTGSKFLPISTEIEVVPRAESGKIKYDITAIRTGGIEAPKTVKDFINAELGNNLDALFSGFSYGFRIDQVTLREGFIDIYGQKAS